MFKLVLNIILFTEIFDFNLGCTPNYLKENDDYSLKNDESISSFDTSSSLIEDVESNDIKQVVREENIVWSNNFINFTGKTMFPIKNLIERSIKNSEKMYDENYELSDGMSEEEIITHQRKLIVPGTKWCGDGNIADHPDDLGIYPDTDKCCRAHDNCDDYIETKGSKYNLTNDSAFTKLHCNCDREFFNCLKKVNSVVSKEVGVVYFDIYGTKCYKLEYPVTKCVSYNFQNHCLKYEYDETQEKIWQWFDVSPFFNNDEFNV